MCLTAGWKPRKDCHRPESWASPQGGTCDSCQMCRQPLLPPSPSFSLSLSLLSFLTLRNYLNSKSVFRKKLSLILHFFFLFLSDASSQFVKTHLRGHSSNFCHVKAMLFSSVGLAPHVAPEAKTADFLFLLNNETQIGINSQKVLRIFLHLIPRGSDQDKKCSLIASRRHFSFCAKHLVFTCIFGRKKGTRGADKSCNASLT